MTTHSATSVDDPRTYGRVAVLMGGWSAEREVSLQTGAACHAALVRRGVDAVAIDFERGMLGELAGGGFDRVFLALHGRGGEDGSIQGALELLGLPYTGSGVTASAVCMDKLLSKRLFAAAGVATPDYAVIDSPAALAEVEERFGLPVIVKPAREGSSVGMTKVETIDALEPAWRAALDHDRCVLVEPWIDGAEYTAGVLDGQCLPLIRIEAANVFYDYDAKYLSERTRYHCPAGLDEATETRWRALALEAFDALGASGWGRVDFLVGADGKPSFLEVNTIPGMTTHSLVPKAAATAGIDFDELVLRILATSVGRTTLGGAA